MKWIPNFILYYLLFALGAGLIVLAVVVARNNNITRVNAVTRAARKAYVAANYKDAFHDLKYLVDTLNFTADEAKLDLAHAGYLASRFDSAGNLVRDAIKKNIPADTAGMQKMLEEATYATALENYEAVAAASPNDRLASIGFNQMGVITYSVRDIEEIGKEEEAMEEAANYFKSAIKKDPANEFARYNYELLRKRIQFPEAVMSQVRSLVHQRKYKEARKLLRNALEQDSRMKKNYSDYIQRLENVISIDSLSRS